MSEYISREALLEKEKHQEDWNMFLDYVTIDDVKSIPSADVRPNIHAEWEKPTGKITPFGDETIQCTECGFFTEEDSVYVYNFCPNCGADMREPKGEKGET